MSRYTETCQALTAQAQAHRKAQEFNRKKLQLGTIEIEFDGSETKIIWVNGSSCPKGFRPFDSCGDPVLPPGVPYLPGVNFHAYHAAAWETWLINQ